MNNEGVKLGETSLSRESSVLKLSQFLRKTNSSLTRCLNELPETDIQRLQQLLANIKLKNNNPTSVNNDNNIGYATLPPITRMLSPPEAAVGKRKKRKSSSMSDDAASLFVYMPPLGPSNENLRVLVVTSQPFYNKHWNGSVDLLSMRNERALLSNSIRRSGVCAKVFFLWEATLSNLVDVFKKNWDIVHISCHGDEEGLWLEDGEGCAKILSVDTLREYFLQNPNFTQLLVLSACQSELIAKSLLQAKINNDRLAIIASQGSVEEPVASLFAEQFYRTLAATTGNVESAFNLAMEAIKKYVLNGNQLGKDDAPVPMTESQSSGLGAENNVPTLEQHTDNTGYSFNAFVLLGRTSVKLDCLSWNKGVYQEEYFPDFGVSSCLSNLPQLHNFIGRGQEITGLLEAFHTNARISICGPGGIGKTELAKALGWWYADRAKMRAIIWFSADKRYSTDHSSAKKIPILNVRTILDVTLSVFKYPESYEQGASSVDLEELKSLKGKIQVVYRLLQSHPTLIVFDRWEVLQSETRLEIWSFILGLSWNTKVLFTSRHVLPPKDVYNSMLWKLPSHEASKLFWTTMLNSAGGYRFTESSQPYPQHHHRRVTTVTEHQLVKQINSFLGGHPLAIVIAASQTRSKSLHQVWEDLWINNNALSILKELNEITGCVEGVWTNFKNAFRALSSDEQTVFSKLCIFPYNFNKRDIEILFSRDERTDNTVDGLVRKCFVRRNDQRSLSSSDSLVTFSIHPLLRQFGRSRVKHLIFKLHFRVLQHLQEETTWESFLRASKHLKELAFVYHWQTAASRYLSDFPSFMIDFQISGQFKRARKETEKALCLARLIKDTLATVALKRTLGEMLFSDDKRELSTACAYVWESICEVRAFSESLGNIDENDPRQITKTKIDGEIWKSMVLHAYLLAHSGEIERARKILADSMEIARVKNLVAPNSSIHVESDYSPEPTRGNSNGETDNEEVVKQLISLFHRLGKETVNGRKSAPVLPQNYWHHYPIEQEDMITALYYCGVTEMLGGQWAEASSYFERCFSALTPVISELEGVSFPRFPRLSVDLVIGNNSQTKKLRRFNARVVYRLKKCRCLLARIFLQGAYLAKKQQQDIAPLLTEGLALSKQLESDLLISTFCVQLARATSLSRDYAQAISLYEMAFAYTTKTIARAKIKTELAGIHCSLKNYTAAKALFEEALALFSKVEDRSLASVPKAHTIIQYAIMEFSFGQLNVSQSLLSTAYRIAFSINSKALKSEVFYWNAVFSESESEFNRAVEFFRLSLKNFEEFLNTKHELEEDFTNIHQNDVYGHWWDKAHARQGNERCWWVEDAKKRLVQCEKQQATSMQVCTTPKANINFLLS